MNAQVHIQLGDPSGIPDLGEGVLSMSPIHFRKESSTTRSF